jgi:hypothetical protein
MNHRDQSVNFLIQELSTITGRPVAGLSEATPLVGSNAVVNSREMIELLLAVEAFSEQTLHVRFDWTSDSAISEARSSFRTLGTLAEYIASSKVLD